MGPHWDQEPTQQRPLCPSQLRHVHEAGLGMKYDYWGVSGITALGIYNRTYFYLYMFNRTFLRHFELSMVGV